jgi:hypothetical protein
MNVVVVGNGYINTDRSFAERVASALHGQVYPVTPPPAAAATTAPAATATPSAAPTTTAPETVTYIVTGTPGASVTYGPSGSDLSGSVPMTVTQPLGSPLYYAISAQLQGSGSIRCEIKVDGVTIANSVAEGGYNIAQCEISQDPVSGVWQSDN